jgi:hypothetical protein
MNFTNQYTLRMVLHGCVCMPSLTRLSFVSTSTNSSLSPACTPSSHRWTIRSPVDKPQRHICLLNKKSARRPRPCHRIGTTCITIMIQPKLSLLFKPPHPFAQRLLSRPLDLCRVFLRIEVSIAEAHDICLFVVSLSNFCHSDLNNNNLPRIITTPVSSSFRSHPQMSPSLLNHP